LTDIDIRAAAAPRSDQTNYEDLLGGPRTVRVAEVKAGSKEQPIEVHYEGGDGKPYKPCKSMLRVLIASWGDKGADWVGRSMTLYGDHEVVFGGVKIGGIRISHVSHIEQPISVLLSTSRGKRKPYVIKPLVTMTDAQFAAVIKRMASATTEDALLKIAKEIGEDASDQQREQARAAFRARRAELNTTTGETE
jgi:hypothetical protein